MTSIWLQRLDKLFDRSSLVLSYISKNSDEHPKLTIASVHFKGYQIINRKTDFDPQRLQIESYEAGYDGNKKSIYLIYHK